MADRTALLDATEAAALLAPGLGETLGVPFGRPMVAVAATDDDATHAAAMAVIGAPAVVVGVVEGASPPAHILDRFDVVVARADFDPPGGVPRSAVLADDPRAEVDALAAGVAASPAAAVALVQLLRAGIHLSVAEAVVAESWVYSMLQAGPDHQGWLRSRPAPGGGAAAEASVQVARSGRRLDVHLDRAARRNAVSAGLRDGVHEALAVALTDPTVAEVHLWGRGPSFCAGGDLDEFGSAPDPVTAHLVRTTRSPALDLTRCGERLVVHVHGAAVGAGCEWAAFARRVVARDDATFRLPEVSMGLVPGAGGTASIPRRIGRQRTAHLALTGQTIGAEVARAWELVDAVVDREEFAAAQSDALRWTDTA
ncbi:enoyl-CoA hydratase/isomerase family protein [Rhabdothermincola salaria]|uniref:enoyl-CoA hydratase/isomerase family protein n=1 Tax=Rhabdothermincola salaria TaxID=2903142 RepID=UPI001E40D545|nr:enoyl-CoA hydratase/isomerase family protein [Rhabdothermincola salaria]MCD9625168.1 enoyl-CoA hydratase/isomerase family protein [Rhabdothermincola salaria]